MSLLHIIGLIVVAILVSFLYRRNEARVCRRIDERTWPGKGIDVTPVSERIQHVRENYLAVVCARPRDNSRRRRLHAAARCALKQLAYFQNARPEVEDAPHHETHAHSG
jgi:hypothetical protein